ncbi:hypothetical protein [Virgibacillus halodenitrificans]|uniref:spr1630 family ClpXP-sensitive toxin n=1 Tax=Virgibacillus halodenitrificans TaxID=1482 RepID=UPI0002F8B928|nr:hypothetical protein [Virgibacillus halodenitrificans]MCJ0931506.1 hypothetical protein [Virgibacillus halodenitrificans]WHX25671.1 hypothetical protein QNH47_16285 [Virgibacillus halodenitrificans]
MEKYKFSQDHSEIIVQAIVEGYREYIEHRKDRHEKMHISSAFAWTKGNFIESKLAEISHGLNLTFKKAKAGLTWDYLQFIHGETKMLFLIKNAAYFNENYFSQARLPRNNNSKNHLRTYLHELSKINQHIIFPTESLDHSETQQSIQLSLFIPEGQVKEELEQIQSYYNEFHILTYKIDEASQISKIMHYLPNPEDNIAYKIEDLSTYISGAELTDEEREVIAPEQDSDIIDPAAFDIGIFEDIDKKSN